MNTSFSIVTPGYRQASFLELCARSIADQHGSFAVEHIVQEGGGGNEFDAWAARQTFSRVFEESDSGMYDAINRGFRKANGDIIAWLNCDEQYLPGTLAKVSRWFEAHPEADILFGDVILIDTSGIPISYRKALLPMRQHIRHCFLPTFSAATFLRRKVLDQGHFLDTRFRAISDMVWIDRLLASNFIAGTINEPLSTFSQTGANLGQSEVCRKEALLWQSEKGGTLMGASLWSTIHRLRKLMAGAYKIRDVEIEIYQHGSEERVSKSAKVGGRWITSD